MKIPKYVFAPNSQSIAQPDVIIVSEIYGVIYCKIFQCPKVHYINDKNYEVEYLEGNQMESRIFKDRKIKKYFKLIYHTHRSMEMTIFFTHFY